MQETVGLSRTVLVRIRNAKPQRPNSTKASVVHLENLFINARKMLTFLKWFLTKLVNLREISHLSRSITYFNNTGDFASNLSLIKENCLDVTM